MSYASSIRLQAGLRILCGNDFEQLERCGSHHLDSHIRKAVSARETEEEDQDSGISACRYGEEEGEDEESGNENGSASDTDASLLGGNLLFAGLILYSLIPIYSIH